MSTGDAHGFKPAIFWVYQYIPFGIWWDMWTHNTICGYVCKSENHSNLWHFSCETWLITPYNFDSLSCSGLPRICGVASFERQLISKAVLAALYPIASICFYHLVILHQLVETNDSTWAVLILISVDGFNTSKSSWIHLQSEDQPFHLIANLNDSAIQSKT